MPRQLSDFQRQVITLFKEEHPTWGLVKCSTVLPAFFAQITKHQFDGVSSTWRNAGSPAAKMCKKGSGAQIKIHSPIRRQIKALAVTPENSPLRGHLSQRKIARQLGISKGSVFNVLQKSGLKCYHRIKCNF